jgi:hypothetical protein
MARRAALRLARSHCLNVRASKSASSSGAIVATSFTHSATVSGGAGPTPVSSRDESTLSNNRRSAAGSRQSVSPSERPKTLLAHVLEPDHEREVRPVDRG